MKRKRTHTILATITLISVILTSACTAGSANSNTTTSSVPETAVTTTAPAVTGTVMDRIDEPKAEATTAQTTAATAATTKPQETKVLETTAAVATTKPQETKSAETTTTTTKAVTTAKPKPATTTTAATTKPAPEWTETKASGTKYVNTDCYSRRKAVLGAETVKLYSVNDKVTVTAKTDTGYYKLSDGSFIHGDYLSDNKVAQTATTKKAETPKPAATTTKVQESKPAEDNWRFTKQDCEDILKACEKYAKDNGYGYCKPSDFGTVKGKVYQHSSWAQVYANSPAVPNLRWSGYTRKEKMIGILCEEIQLNYEEGLGATCVDYCLASEYCQWAKEHWGVDISNDTACQDMTAYVFFPCY